MKENDIKVLKIMVGAVAASVVYGKYSRMKRRLDWTIQTVDHLVHAHNQKVIDAKFVDIVRHLDN